MMTIHKKCFLTLVLSALTISAFSQCEILNRVSPDGSMYYYMEPVNFYWTSAKSLKGSVITDKESYFLELHPLPFPEKPAGNKLKEDLVLKVSSGETYNLKHFDTRYIENDTVMEMLFLISKKDVDYLLNHEVSTLTIDMKGDEGIRSYELKLHKSALKDQLACFLKDEEKKKKK
jgi:hypothetical protein